MHDMAVCPYFDHDEDICDVGCGYISSHDASLIIRFCSCHYQDCQKYRELTDRLPETALPPRPAVASAKAPGQPSRELPVLGLFCYSLTVASYAFDKLPFAPWNLHLLAVILMVGAVGQITSGLNALKERPLQATAFTGFGLFWLSILALDILPRAGYGSLPGAIPMMGYFAMWGLFSLIICQGLERLSRICRSVFALMTAFLLLLAVAHVVAHPAVLHAAALVGLASCLPGFYLGLRQIGKEAITFLSPAPVRSGKVRS